MDWGPFAGSLDVFGAQPVVCWVVCLQYLLRAAECCDEIFAASRLNPVGRIGIAMSAPGSER